MPREVVSVFAAAGSVISHGASPVANRVLTTPNTQVNYKSHMGLLPRGPSSLVADGRY